MKKTPRKALINPPQMVLLHSENTRLYRQENQFPSKLSSFVSDYSISIDLGQDQPRGKSSQYKRASTHLTREIKLKKRLNKKSTVGRNHSFHHFNDRFDLEGVTIDGCQDIGNLSCYGEVFGENSIKEKRLKQIYPKFKAEYRRQMEYQRRAQVRQKMKTILRKNVERIKLMGLWRKSASLTAHNEQEQNQRQFPHHRTILISPQTSKFSKHQDLKGQSVQQFLWRLNRIVDSTPKNLNQAKNSNKDTKRVEIDLDNTSSDTSMVTNAQKQRMKKESKFKKIDNIRLVGCKTSKTVHEFVKSMDTKKTQSQDKSLISKYRKNGNDFNHLRIRTEVQFERAYDQTPFSKQQGYRQKSISCRLKRHVSFLGATSDRFLNTPYNLTKNNNQQQRQISYNGTKQFLSSRLEKSPSQIIKTLQSTVKVENSKATLQPKIGSPPIRKQRTNAIQGLFKN